MLKSIIGNLKSIIDSGLMCGQYQDNGDSYAIMVMEQCNVM